jgi:general secretion pathway protein B
MSSILKALKKLESEKAQRDELSTAVASDILRSSRSKTTHAALKIAGVAVAVILIAAAGYYLALKTIPVQPAKITPVKPVVQQNPVVKKETAPPTIIAAPATTPSQNLPRLSGIVYQQDPQSRLAIINDLPVMEGTLVEDFEVKTIYPDRVLLLKNSTEFTLPLEQK